MRLRERGRLAPREENRRKDEIIMSQALTVLQLTVPREPSGATEPPIKTEPLEPAEPADPRRSEAERGPRAGAAGGGGPGASGERGTTTAGEGGPGEGRARALGAYQSPAGDRTAPIGASPVVAAQDVRRVRRCRRRPTHRTAS